MGATSLHLLMYPWFALGHFTSYLHLSNKLAQKGHRISFLIPTKTQSKLQTLNLYPDLITFVPISLPHVDGLPLGAETTSDVPVHLQPLIMTAMDRSESHIELLLRELQPDIVFFDFAHWIPKLVRSLVLSSSSIKLHVHEERALAALKTQNFGSDVLLADRLITSDQSYRSQLHLPELVLGLELSGWPFLAALKPPCGADSIEEAFPEGFEDRVQGRGIVHGGWVQQLQILEHPSIGCFITHCGLGSLFEALMNKCQLVLLPHICDQFFNARMMSNILKVGVEVQKGEEDGLFTKESVCKAVKIVMEVGSEVGREVRANHAKLRELLSSEDLESSYIDGFCQNLENLVG
ncbi:hypothetical protein CMV_027524 [Castanea mollissima]|uniref:UDP-glycosyltransferases domain-containing protein n=1 Tax=Castanea mollissima TaxID=60419 RepID=A0A8J4V9A4_9ROSI|nr:hypothetical protein CMV_027524 [Castanea mollissima]